MKKIISLILCFCLIFSAFAFTSITASAKTYSGKCGNSLKWSLNDKTGKLIISGKGKMNFPLVADADGYPMRDIPWSSRSNKIKTVIINKGVTEIYSGAFEYCSNLKTVKISNGLKKINDYAFYRCKNLENLTIPNSIKYIDDSAFEGCTKLKKITLPGNLTYSNLGDNVFDCCNIKEITFSKGTKRINSSQPFSGSFKKVTIPNGVKTIDAFAFYQHTSLKSVTIPESVTKIGDHAFGYKFGEHAYKYNWYYDKIPGFTIKGKKGSAAEKYAKNNGFKFVKI